MGAKSRKSGLNLKEKRGERFYKGFIVALSSFLLAFLAASIFAPVSPSDAQELEINNSVTGYYVRISNSDTVSLNVESVATGALASAKSTVNVKTNSPTGYKLYLSASSSDMYESEDTEHTGIHLSGTNGSIDTPVSLSANTWGFALDKSTGSSYSANFADISNYAESGTPSSASTWAAVPSITPVMIDEASSPTADAGEDTDIYYGVNANSRLGTGTYGTTIYYTATAEGAEPIMQEFTASECSSMRENEVIPMMDIRNQAVYNIVKAKDGNCWMADNLELGSATEDTVIYANESNFSSGSFTIPASSNWSGNIYNAAKLHIATKSGYEGEHYYNWCSAAALTGSDCATTNQVNQSICPKGWRLPINGDANQDKSYAKLMNDYGVTTGPDLVNPSHASYILGFTKYYGAWAYDAASEINQGSEGYFWSSTPASGANAYDLDYYTSGIVLQHLNAKDNGFSVRCVFEGETIQDITYMQDMTKAICDATNTGVTARLRDKRGRGNAGSAEDDSYGVIKAKDGNCWMTENFDLYNAEVSSDDSDFPAKDGGIVATFTLPTLSTWAYGRPNSADNYAYAKVNQNTNIGYDDAVYYTWCSAVAKVPCADTSNPSQSICPKNWMLPEGTGNKSYTKLLAAYSATSGAQLTDSNHASYELGFHKYYGFYRMFSDGSGGGSGFWMGSVGEFWLSDSTDAAHAHHFPYTKSSLNTDYSSGAKGHGFAIRCVSRD